MTIRTRIAYGYALVLGLALSGTITGLVIGNHYQRQALADWQSASLERKFFNDLRIRILYNRPSEKLSPHLANRQRFQVESQHLVNRLIVLQRVLKQHHVVRSIYNTDIGEDTEYEALYPLLIDYEDTVAQFLARTKTFVQAVNDLEYTPDTTDEAQRLLLELVGSPEFQAFIEFPTQLAVFTEEVEAREQAAEITLEQAEALRAKIVLVSLFGSVVAAGTVAIYTSRALARPLQVLTEVARQVTEEENFNLRAPDEGTDEVRVQARALNQLIERVQQLLGQLEQKNSALEAAFLQVKQQQIKLVQAEKMSSLGQLVAGLAHEINNPVNFIHGNLKHVRSHINEVMTAIDTVRQYPEILENEAIDLEELEFLQTDLSKILDSMQVGSDRIRQIVLSLRNFSRLDEAACKLADIHEGLDNSLMILQHRLKAKSNRPAIHVVRDYDALPEVACCPGQLNQVYMNILVNAIDAIEERYEQAIDKQQVPLAITLRTTRLPSGWIEIAIADTGTGMTDEVRQKLFNSFFTTKPEGIGTGLGMSISHQIITETHQGKIDCVSTPGIGTEFLIRIPNAETNS
ncbi:MAG: ATP-binding protein [Cyanobacteria bacterium P01_H01_bin.58]